MAEISLEDDEVMDSSAMAEAMGFSGFGMQRPPSKKRKFNPHADAAVSAPANGKVASTTGANMAPLGQRKMRLPPPSSSDLPARPPTSTTADGAGAGVGKTDTGEIDLDDHYDVNPDGPDSRYMDTSRPARGYLLEELAEIEAQEKIDAILASSSGSIPGLPAPPPPGTGEEGFVGYRGQRQHGQRGRGTNNKQHRSDEGAKAPWWQGYYDPKMNQNPWEALETKMGLGPRGTWVPRNGKLAKTETREQEMDIATEEEKAGKDHPDESL